MQEYGEQPAILSPTSQEDFQQNKSAAIKKRTPFLLKPLVFLRDEMLDLTRWSYWSYFATPSLGIRRAQSLSAILALEDGGRLAPLRGSFQPGIDPDVISARRRARRMHLEPGKPRNEVEGWPCFRTTALSMLPSELLGHRLNELTWKIIKAPLNILLCRSVLFAYRSQSSDTMVRNKSGFAVVSRGFLETLKDEKWGLIVGKIGLCVALEATISTVVWTGAYWFASSFRARESRRRNP
ncbi:hypothetical protein K461DRAFT_4370 [Myriangium duriaei CBS 260.36]|uniref:Uncharacterized protein n=1 Tax=Myriangium duriaei CBS 260.36 TaxID=1168546 RepID=A0A9P4MP21_9PEZI|nr:hypothetical protein K461DRAFT_4370 [Myriangium duriaei CBS 260.36]